MTASTQKHLTDLAEVNRALTQDLDISRRIVTELRHENDLLLRNAHDAKERAELAERVFRVLAVQIKQVSREEPLPAASPEWTTCPLNSREQPDPRSPSP